MLFAGCYSGGTRYYQNGQVRWRDFQDGQGRIEKTVVYYESGSVYSVSQYNHEGGPSECIVYRPDGSVKEKKNFDASVAINRPCPVGSRSPGCCKSSRP